MLNVAPQKERIPDHLRAMAEQDDKSAASGKTGEQSSIGVGCAGRDKKKLQRTVKPTQKAARKRKCTLVGQ